MEGSASGLAYANERVRSLGTEVPTFIEESGIRVFSKNMHANASYVFAGLKTGTAFISGAFKDLLDLPIKKQDNIRAIQVVE